MMGFEKREKILDIAHLNFERSIARAMERLQKAIQSGSNQEKQRIC